MLRADVVEGLNLSDNASTQTRRAAFLSCAGILLMLACDETTGTSYDAGASTDVLVFQSGEAGRISDDASLDTSVPKNQCLNPVDINPLVPDPDGAYRVAGNFDGMHSRASLCGWAIS